MVYFQLFLSFFQIGLFSIGGGYAALPLIQNQVVEINHWLTMIEFADVITIAEMTPGPIAINAATFVGIQIAGIGGAVAATIGCIFPSSLIVLTLAFFYYRYKNLTVVQSVLNSLRPAVVALIAVAGLSILKTALWGSEGISSDIARMDFVAAGLFVVCLIILRKFKPSPIYVIAGSGVVGMGIYLILQSSRGF